MDFTLESFFNPHLPSGVRRIDAVLTVTGSGAAAAGGQPAVGIVIDVSMSMTQGGKIEAARHAARRCIQLLPPNALFTVIAFAGRGHPVVPLCEASVENKARADRAIQSLGLESTGTRMSTGLNVLRSQLSAAPGAIGYGYFLTDGQNEDEDRRDVEAEIAAGQGRYQCDCRGIGTDWEPQDIRRIAAGLLGTADAVARPEGLEADFRACLEHALGKGTGDVRLRLWKPSAVALASLHQMTPEDIDMTAMVVPFDARSVDLPLGAWGEEARDYHAVFTLGEGEVGEEVLACRPSLVWTEGGVERKVAGTPVVATWSDDAELTTRINPEVAHYTGQAELAASIKEGLEARDRGQYDAATRLLGNAARIAAESGNDEVTRRLSKVVDVIDAADGTVRLKRDAGKADTLELEMGGTRTVRRSRTAG